MLITAFEDKIGRVDAAQAAAFCRLELGIDLFMYYLRFVMFGYVQVRHALFAVEELRN